MIGKFFLILTICTYCERVNAQDTDVKNGLKVSTDKHRLVDAKTGSNIFILATTAWNINALTYPELDTLIESTAAHGFNSIMFALDFSPQGDESNAYGQKAYIGADKTDLNPAYFAYSRYIIDKCTALHLYPMVYTMWAGKTAGTMNNYTAAQLYILGTRIGREYRRNKNVILVAGGESSPPYVDTARVNAMGRGLKEGSGGNNLLTVHPCSPHSSSAFYKGEAWLDFYMTQAKSDRGGTGFDLTKDIVRDYNLDQVKPTMVAEHRYESGTTEDPVIQTRSLYLSVFAGGFGYAYGHNALWQMTPHTAKAWMLKSWNPGVRIWKDALNTTAEGQLHHIGELLYVFPDHRWFPDQGLVPIGQGDSVGNMVKVLRNGTVGKNDATCVMAYLSSFKEITIKTDVIPTSRLDTYWFNPHTGSFDVINRGFKNTGSYTPGQKVGLQDCVLVIKGSNGHGRPIDVIELRRKEKKIIRL